MTVAKAENCAQLHLDSGVQRFEPRRITQLNKVSPNHRTHQRPEMVARMGVILRGGQRRIARQAAQYQQPRIGARDRRQSRLAAQ